MDTLILHHATRSGVGVPSWANRAMAAVLPVLAMAIVFALVAALAIFLRVLALGESSPAFAEILRRLFDLP
jgi:hypothetical protein